MGKKVFFTMISHCWASCISENPQAMLSFVYKDRSRSPRSVLWSIWFALVAFPVDIVNRSKEKKEGRGARWIHQDS